MANPRPPQRGPQRQPTPPRGQPQRPVRVLPPGQQPSPIEVERKLRKGQTYWIVGSPKLSEPRRGKIVRLSSDPSRTVGVEFNEPVPGVNHNCDGHGAQGFCLYVRPEHVLDERAMQAYKARQPIHPEPTQFEEFDELTVGPASAQPLTPPPLELEHSEAETRGEESVEDETRETMTIEPGDVGKISAENLFRKPKEEDEAEDEDKDEDE